MKNPLFKTVFFGFLIFIAVNRSVNAQTHAEADTTANPVPTNVIITFKKKMAAERPFIGLLATQWVNDCKS